MPELLPLERRVAPPPPAAAPHVAATVLGSPAVGAAPLLHLVHDGGRCSARGATAVRLGATEPRPDGVGWASWRWDGRRLVVETCRYGIRPLYYCARPNQIMVSPSIPALLAAGAPADLDPAALAVYLRFENLLAEDTPFAHIRAMPPGGRLTWDGTLAVRGSLHIPRPEPVAREVALARYAALFRAAVERCAPPRAIVPLSGGRDSRHIAFELARLGITQECVTVHPMPPRRPDDVAVATSLARALGAPHTVLPQSGDRYDAQVRATLESSYGGREHAWFRPLQGYVAAARGADGADKAVLDGLAGDVLSAGLFLDAEALDLHRRGRLSELAFRYLRGHAGPLRFLADQEIAPTRLALARLCDELDRHQRAANPVGSFFFWNRTRRVVALQSLALLAGAPVLMPFLDPAVFDFLASLPAELFLDRRFHTEAIHQAFPRFADLPFAGPSRKGPVDRAHFRRYARRVLRHLDVHPSRLIDRRHCLPRFRLMALAGNVSTSWVMESCLYLSLLEQAGG